MSLWAIALLLPATAVAAANWRKGLFAMLAVAFLQDPARKLDLDRPVYFTVLVGVVFAVAYARAQMGGRFRLSRLPGWKQHLAKPFRVFLLVLGVEGLISIVRYSNPIIAGIGAMSYLAPVPAMLAGYHFALKGGPAGIQRWLTWYVIGALILLPTIVLEYAGFDWPVLGDVGVGFEMYVENAILTAHSGFFRSSETAAWHTASTVCMLLLLSSLRKLSTRQVVVAVGVVVLLLSIGVLTGRRKIFVEILIFMSTYVALLLWFGKGGMKLAVGVFVGGVLSFMAVTWWVVEQPAEIAASGATAYRYYAERSNTVGNDISDRFVDLGLDPVFWAIEGYGVFGGGLGIASQGGQHFGAGAGVFGGAGEGGLGKITAELGVPGLLIVLWLGAAAVRYGWQVLLFVSGRSSAVARLAYGIVAFLIANLSVFFVATQVFGDLFVLLLLGLLAGFFLATPVLAERERVQPVAAQGAARARSPGRVAVLRERA